MGLIQDYFNRLREKKAQREAFEGEQHMVQGFQQKQLSSNERELMRIQEEERQKRIKQILDSKRKEENQRIWSGQHHNPAHAPNVVAGQKNLFGGGNMFAKAPNVANQPNVVNCKNIFCGGKKK